MLEVNLRSQLNGPRRKRGQFLSKAAGIEVRVNPVRIELCVVEQVVKFKAEFERGALRDLCIFHDRKIEVVAAWSVNEVAARIALRADRRRRECPDLARWSSRRATDGCRNRAEPVAGRCCIRGHGHEISWIHILN